ncbi:MAG TPA: hypothetical protein VGZ50_07995 [Actinomycetota bacterium]|nr:hypothetical protein [Actinomycetota bacterium]
MGFLLPGNYLVAAGKSVPFEWPHGGGPWQGPQIAYPVNYLAANEWLQVTGQGVFYDYSIGKFRYFATFDNTRGRETASFQIQVGGLT